ncbi:HDOD domain-containing protein [Sulfurivermis fontis]|uniref:HDOD domain-containing protein n=1 Tax=Sulfurivermis fontis TaxID=1972068 RepID=UPI000FDB3F07|nr:HDOD domain-containing protein [Sulfurivermis fontis]
MNIPTTVRNYLARKGGQYKVHAATAGLSLADAVRAARVPVQKLVRSAVLKDGSSYLMAVYPATHRLDLTVLNGNSRRNFVACSSEELKTLLADSEVAALPPLGEPYGIKVIVDRSVDELDEVFFTPGIGHLFVRAQQKDFTRLTEGALRGHRISNPVSKAATPAEGKREGMKEKVEKVHALPAMPGIATQILGLRNNPYANANELAAVIEQDPSLTAQLLRYAASPFYAYQGKLTSVEQAIVRVLGMDFVMDFSLGLALGKSFRNPKDGPLGLDAFWRDALHTAALTQTLCNAIEFSRRPAPGIAYMAGLLHNFGFLLLGHLFPEQFKRLNKAVAEQPDRSILDLEREIVGVTHTEMGLWLVDAWNLPKEIVETVREHHNGDYRGDYAIYPNLVHIANRLLKRFGMGDATGIDLSAELLAAVGLTEEQAEAALGTVLQMREGLQFMARKMAA